jgi:hypothetical protein
MWQSKAPRNLNNYLKPKDAQYYLYHNLRRVAKYALKRKTTRNWEIQFFGSDNKTKLTKLLSENKNLREFVPIEIIEKYINYFYEKDSVKYSHPISMLLTFSVFLNKNKFAG